MIQFFSLTDKQADKITLNFYSINLIRENCQGENCKGTTLT